MKLFEAHLQEVIAGIETDEYCLMRARNLDDAQQKARRLASTWRCDGRKARAAEADPAGRYAFQLDGVTIVVTVAGVRETTADTWKNHMFNIAMTDV